MRWIVQNQFGWIVVLVLATITLRPATGYGEERSTHKWEFATGITPLSYGFYDALGGDGHFDQFTTIPAAGLELGGNYLHRRYFAFGAAAGYVFSLGRTDFWSRDYKPGVHRFRLGPQVQFRMPGDSVEPFLNLSGGLSAIASKNYDSSYRATGFYGSLGLGGNIHLTDRLGMYVRYSLSFDDTVVTSMDGNYATYMEDVPILAFLQEVTFGLLIRL